ncbi:MAG: glycosyltransferase [Vicinamibacterales bacterium]
MRALLVAVGTRGDVQPALALALALKRHGHGVRLCVSPNFVEWAKSLELDAVPMGVEMRAPAPRSGSAPALTPEQIRKLRESMPDLITDQFDTIAAVVDGCDVIVGANAHQYGGPSIAEQRGIGCVTAVYAPVVIPSADLAPPPAPGQPATADTSLSIEERWRQTSEAWNERALERVNRNRDRLGLAPIADVLDYVLTNRPWLAADAALAPVPSTPGRTVLQTGGWVLRDETPLPDELEAFLAAGDPPVFVGFGSMPAPLDVSAPVIAAVRSCGRRVLVSSGWAGLDRVDDGADCMVVKDVSHAALFRRVAAVVHHGGAGTTAAAARAGVPQVITPMFSDQFYWASRVVALGIGAATPHVGLSASSLADALRTATAPATAMRARTVAGAMRDDGADVAARQLEAEFDARAR